MHISENYKKPSKKHYKPSAEKAKHYKALLKKKEPVTIDYNAMIAILSIGGITILIAIIKVSQWIF